MKTCTCCKQKSDNFGRDARRKDGLSIYCRPCKREKSRAYKQAHPGSAKQTKDARRRAILRREFGITLEQEQAIFESQEFRCGICTKPASESRHGRLYLDHSATTGVIRGGLCHLCNLAIGLFRDDPEFLCAAASYLERESPHGTIHGRVIYQQPLSGDDWAKARGQKL